MAFRPNLRVDRIRKKFRRKSSNIKTVSKTFFLLFFTERMSQNLCFSLNLLHFVNFNKLTKKDRFKSITAESTEFSEILKL